MKIKNFFKNRSKIGSLTIEASITVPVFIAVVFGIAIFMKAVFFHGVMQNALDETTSSLATFSYIYQEAGASDYLGELDGVQSILGVIDTMKDADVENVEMLNDMLASGVDDVATRAILVPVIRTMIRGHFVNGSSDVFDVRLRSLHVRDGIDGLDFSGTSFLKDGKTIELMVRYRLNLPNFMGLLPDIVIVQRSSARAWLDGQKHPSFVQRVIEDSKNEQEKGELKDENEGEKKEKEEKYVWLDGNFARGRELSEIFGRNLPSNFPTIAKFENGRAVSITSIDPTSTTYLQPRNLRRRIVERIEKIAEFEGANWAGVNISLNDIEAREVLIIFPEPRELLTAQMKTTLNECRTIANEMGISLRFEHFGVLEESTNKNIKLGQLGGVSPELTVIRLLLMSV